MTITGAHEPSNRMALRIVGFVVSLAILGWCVSVVFRGQPGEPGPMERLSRASASHIAALLALSAASLLLNGLIFWTTLLPVRRLDARGVVAVNALATMLNYLPFKLGLITRVVVHHRRDRVPLAMIGAWIAAFVFTLLLTVTPVALVGGWEVSRGVFGSWWIVLGVGSTAAATAATAALARVFAGANGLARLHRMTDPLRIAPLDRVLRSRAWSHLHAGFDMLADPHAVGASAALRLADLTVQAARFAVAAGVVGRDLPPDHALLAAAAHFIIGALSPFGTLGPREGLLTLVGSEDFALIVLVVSAAEAIVNLAGGTLALIWLRPDRLLNRRVSAPTPDSRERA